MKKIMHKKEKAELSKINKFIIMPKNKSLKRFQKLDKLCEN